MWLFLSFQAFIVLHLIHGIVIGTHRDHESLFSRQYWSQYTDAERNQRNAVRAAAREFSRFSTRRILKGRS